MELHFALLSIGALFLVGLIADLLGRQTHVPRVTLLMLVGVLLGPPALDVLPAELEHWYEFLAAAALTMVAFLLGGALSLSRLRHHGREILVVSATVVAASGAGCGWRACPCRSRCCFPEYPPRPPRRRRWMSCTSPSPGGGSRGSCSASSRSTTPGG